jgi:tetratricopeptide (TPR) repeat protein
MGLYESWPCVELPGQYRQCNHRLHKAIRLDSKYAIAYYNRGNSWADKGEFDKAIRDFNEAVHLDPEYKRAYFNRGATWQEMDEFEKGIKDYTKVIQLDPQDAVAFNNRGVAWAGAGELDKAIQDYSKAIWLESQFAYAYSNRASIWSIKREYAKAVNDYAEGIRLDSQDVSACNEFAWLLATCPEAEFRDGLDAVILGENLCELSEWKEAGYINTLAAAYAEFGDFDQAVKYQKRCIEQLDKDVDKDEYMERLKLYGEGKPYHEARGDGKRE